MTTANPLTPKVIAALLVIGDKILSGRTKDKNIGYIAEYLSARYIPAHLASGTMPAGHARLTAK